MSIKHGSLSPQAFKRLQGGELILRGFDNEDIADIVDVSTSAVAKWRKKLKANGDKLHALARKKGAGRRPKLTEAQKQQLKDIILAGAIKSGFPDERWTSKRVAEVIRRTFKVNLHHSSVRRVLRTLGLSPQMPVVKSHKHDDEEVLHWAKHTWKRLKKKRKDSACP